MNQENATTEPVPTISSFLTRAANVFASPGELYDEVAQVPVQTSSWLVPFLCMLLLAILSAFIVFSNPTFRDQILEPQRQELQKEVEKGKMTQEQADKATEMMEGGPMTLVIGTVSSAVVVTLVFFSIPLLLWLIVKFGFKSSADYKKILEVLGLTALIGILGSIVSLLMMHVFNTMYASPSGILFVMNSYDRHNVAHSLLAALNVFTLWQVVVAGVGIGKVGGKSSGVGVGTVLGLWLVWTIISSMLGWGFR